MERCEKLSISIIHYIHYLLSEQTRSLAIRMNTKTFAIPVLTAFLLTDALRIGIAIAFHLQSLFVHLN